MQRSREKQQNEKDQRSLQENQRKKKGTFDAKMGSIKDRNGKDLTEAEDIFLKKARRIHRTTV